MLEYIFRHGGVFPIRRGHHDEEAFKTAYTILDRGGCMLMYAEGGRSRTGGLGEPKPGIGRIALESGVRSSRSRSTARSGCAGGASSRFPKVTVQFGEPISFPVERRRAASSSWRSRGVFDRVREMYGRWRRRAAAA